MTSIRQYVGMFVLSVAAGMLISHVAVSQTPDSAPSVIQLSEIPLPLAGPPLAKYTGAVGATTYCYEVVVTYAVGNSMLGPASCVSNVDGTTNGTVTLSWNPPTLENGPPAKPLAYDVVRLIGRTTFPDSGTCSACLVTSQTTVANTIDFVNAMSFADYTPKPYALGSYYMTIDNTSSDVNQLVVSASQNGKPRVMRVGLCDVTNVAACVSVR